MSRRKRSEEFPNHERWLVSYADFITLLFAFFVVMYSISSLNEDKYKIIAESLGDVFMQAERPAQLISVGEETPRAIAQEPEGVSGQIQDPLEGIAQSLRQGFGGMLADGRLKLRGNETWLEIELNSSLLFSSGDAIPNDSALLLIEGIAKILAPYRNPIKVEGYTDNLPISTASYPTNWELSAARAASVVRLLAAHGVTPARLSAVGYGEYQPVADNRNALGRARNRRVVLAISRDLDIPRLSSTFDTAMPPDVGMQPAEILGTQGAVPDSVNSPSSR